MKTKMNQDLIELFNMFVSDNAGDQNIQTCSETGIVVSGRASKKQFTQVKAYASKGKLSGEQLNKTFYASFADVTNKSRDELFLDQVLHYATTYGQLIPGYVYVPAEAVDRKLPKEKLTLFVLAGVDESEAIKRASAMLTSGIALNKETMETLVEILEYFNFDFSSVEIKNKEAIVYLAANKDIMPTKAEDFLRFVIYKATGSTLLIKDRNNIRAIKAIDFSGMLQSYVAKNGYQPLAEVFNRFKPLFIKMKNNKSAKIINKIAKLSKKLHKPLPVNALSEVTQRALTDDDTHWLKNATTFALLKATDACFKARAEFNSDAPTARLYTIRNGRVFAKKTNRTKKIPYGNNITRIAVELESRVNGKGKTVYIPEDIDYALPTSEKMFIGNIPVFTKFQNKMLNVGMYWENNMGASDLDLSSISITGDKIGWNSGYSNEGIIYSGDQRYADNGATEYLNISTGCGDNIVYLNVYSGDSNSEYDLIIGKAKNKRAIKTYMQDPKNVMVSGRRKTQGGSSILGLVSETESGVQFIPVDYNVGQNAVSGYKDYTSTMITAMKFSAENRLSLHDVLSSLGYNVVRTKTNEVDVDLSIENLSKDTIINLLTENKK
jgi:hypothetical protein